MTRMKFKQLLIATSLVSVLWACASGSTLDALDQEPMYGAVDEKAQNDTVAKGRTGVDSAIAQFGSAPKASEGLANQGFELYQKGDLNSAMRHFNKAWLVNSNNPEAYWGFALVLTERNKFCDALVMANKAQTQGALGSVFLTDAALIYTGCALEQKSTDFAVRAEYLTKSDAMFEQALGSSGADKKEYVLYHWARALYKRGDYAGAWDKVFTYRQATGKDLDARFVRMLGQKMREPH
jgi:tetratricopeptide (TPR) repeat protein